MELELVAYLGEMNQRFHRLTFKEVQSLAYEYAECNNIEHPLNKDMKLAGRDWVYGFLARHPHLCLRKPEGMNVTRAIGFNKGQMVMFFKHLPDINAEYDFLTKPTRTYNMDGSVINTIPNKLPKIASGKGQRNVSKIVSGSINAGLFLTWLQHFASHTKPSADDPILLIHDITLHTFRYQPYNFVVNTTCISYLYDLIAHTGFSRLIKPSFDP
ncbi:hypothetical protein PR048_014309 [Dryococelus australis]|uniref:HTH CENPB-type domain-containing protein n=1 Tax=Dryococelus australis TaxID=614101 RepID=A0ABQ9HDV8_9NEOP|nr:hypothetical protein PR048_014309 [Dryococelus australis]